jgi:hypothetical protein
MASPARRLGPMGLGDVMDETIRVYRAGFKTFVATMAVPMIPLFILVVLFVAAFGAGIVTDVEQIEPTLLIVGGILVVVVFGLSYLVLIILGGAASTGITRDLWRGEPTSVRKGYAEAGRRFWSLLGAALLVVLAVIGLYLVSIPLLITMIVGWLVVPIGLIVWFVNPTARRPWLKWAIILCTPMGLAIYFFGLWSLYIQTVVIEGLGPVDALRRSKQLVQGYWWRVFGTVVLMGILVSILQAIPQYLFAAIGGLILVTEPGSSAGIIVGQVFSNIGTAVGWALFGAVTFIALTIVYYDLRVRKEALDLEVLTERMVSLDKPRPS